MVGSALVRRLAREGAEVLTVPHAQLDLRRQVETEAWIATHRPDAIFMAAAKVGGILANDSFPGQFLYDNLMIQSNIVEAARQNNVEKVMLLGSSCIYPRMAPPPRRGACHRPASACRSPRRGAGESRRDSTIERHAAGI
jgi:GDP-L-fucose synthase